MLHIVSSVFFALTFLCKFINVSCSNSNVHYLVPSVTYNRTTVQTIAPEIYCYIGSKKNPINIWETVLLQVSIVNEFDQFDGHTPDEVYKQFDEQKSSWNFFSNMYAGKKRNIRLYPFNQTCIGIVSPEVYSVKLHKIRVDYWKVLIFLAGMSLYHYSPLLCKNAAFYYMTGMSFGVCASILILIWVISRFIPRKPFMYSFIAGGWTVFAYLINLLWDNMRVVVSDYKSWVFSYVSLASVVSFAICYRYGPVNNPRTIDLIRWSLQACGLSLIFVSSELQEASLSVVLITLFCYNLAHRLKPVVQWIWKIQTTIICRPKPRRLLNEEEYHEQGVIETKKALDELRGYCSSPECNQWKMMLRLKDPLRFAKFATGESHLSDVEVLEADNRNFGDLITDDSESDND